MQLLEQGGVLAHNLHNVSPAAFDGFGHPVMLAGHVTDGETTDSVVDVGGIPPC